MIVAENLVKHFRKVHAVNGVDFVAPDGQVLGLLGPNGAGKTTIMRLLSTIMKPTSGRATVGGLDTVRDAEKVRKILGVLPEYWGLYGRFTPREHFRYFGNLYGLDGAELERRIDWVIGLTGVGEFADRQCENFSTGMRQKVAIGRTLLHEPSHLLLDEPTLGLDVMSARKVRSLILEMRSRGCCVILSTHVLSEAERLCDQIVIIDGGKTIAQGTPPELLARAGKDNLEDAFVTLVGREDVEVV